MDKLLNEYLEQIRIEGPLAETLRAVCCYDFGPWVKPSRRRTFYTQPELTRALSLARHILEKGNMDDITVFLINENVNKPNDVTVFRAPKEQYPRFPINYHVGINALELPEDGKTTYTEMCKVNFAVPVQLFATLFGSALGRFSPYTFNPTILRLHADEVEGMVNLTDYGPTDVLKAAFILKNMELLLPGRDPAEVTITAEFIPTEGMLEHVAGLYGELVTPMMEIHLIQLLDSARFYGATKLFNEHAVAILYDGEETHYFDVTGRTTLKEELLPSSDVIAKAAGNYVEIPEKFKEVMLAADNNDIITFFGGTPSPALSLAPSSPGQESNNFQLDSK